MNRIDAALSFRTALARALKDEIETFGGATKLAQAIVEANQDLPDDFRVDRRKLKDLSEERDVKVSFYELAALDAFLSKRGRGLSVLTQKPSLLKPLGYSGRIAFLLAAKPQHKEHNTVLSRWDVLAFSDLQRALDRVTPGVRFGFEDVLLRDDIDADAGPVGAFGRDSWFELIDMPGAQSLVCLGAPRACHAAECLLSKMFGVAPFRPPDLTAASRPPFFFLAPSDVGLPSSLTLTAPAGPGAQNSSSEPRRYVGIQVEGKTYLLSHHGTTWSEYGLLAAQRRASGQIWLVIAGMTGPATFATARILETLGEDLPPANPGRDSAVLWGVVKAEIAWRGDRRGDSREVIGQELLGSLSRWTPAPARPSGRAGETR